MALMVPNFATVLNLNMVSVALPYVRDALGISTDAATWIMTSYMLPYALLMPLYGRLGDERLGGAIEWMARVVTGEGIAPREEKDAPVHYLNSATCAPGLC